MLARSKFLLLFSTSLINQAADRCLTANPSIHLKGPENLFPQLASYYEMELTVFCQSYSSFGYLRNFCTLFSFSLLFLLVYIGQD